MRPNILAHVRFNEREVNGERVLFIEEIQSDWAQEGKKKVLKAILTKANTILYLPNWLGLEMKKKHIKRD